MMAKKSNYKVRFRHGVYPNLESQATRADIKKYDYFFGSEQTWVQTSGKGMYYPYVREEGADVDGPVDFVDDSTQIGNDGDCAGTPSSAGDWKVTARRATRSRSAHARRSTASRWRSRNIDSTFPEASSTFGNEVEDLVSTDADIYHPRHTVIDMCPYESSGPGSVSSLDEIAPSLWQDELPSPVTGYSGKTEYPVSWPLTDPLEAYLFRFWVEEAAGWWDSTSSNGIFKRIVSTLASQNSMLLSAILMYSAQHIQRFHANFPANPYFYHERLLQHLIPHLAEKGRIEDEATLVAAMLLRAFEEFHGKLPRRRN
ncbi:hypothetical protein J1614_011471 [Plenodomus biglobosus]|nr:hypothetical protein J1614_011471 [Plenodomus biglobosus]